MNSRTKNVYKNSTQLHLRKSDNTTELAELASLQSFSSTQTTKYYHFHFLYCHRAILCKKMLAVIKQIRHLPYPFCVLYQGNPVQ
jgi:hypothetical protein